MSDTTHTVSLWLNNEEGLYRACGELAQDAMKRSRRGKDGARLMLSDAIKDFVTEMTPELTGMFSDLMTAALSDVNWFDLADEFLEEIDEEEGETEEKDETDDDETAED